LEIIYRLPPFLVAAATLGVLAFNWMAAAGHLAGVDTGAISDKYQTVVTPAGYAFSIWGLIYAGLIVFTIYQLLPSVVRRFREVRSLYILSCALNCAWLFFWHLESIVVCTVLLAALAVVLYLIARRVSRPETWAEFFAVKAPFGIYFGWVTAAALVNFAVMLVYLDAGLSPMAWSALGASLVIMAAAFGVVAAIRRSDHLYPLAIAWALTAIAVKQGAHTLIVTACAVGVVACLIAALSFVLKLPTFNPR
jgi:translocator protein